MIAAGGYATVFCFKNFVCCLKKVLAVLLDGGEEEIKVLN
jgi:hypothetical protein